MGFSYAGKLHDRFSVPRFSFRIYNDNKQLQVSIIITKNKKIHKLKRKLCH